MIMNYLRKRLFEEKIILGQIDPSLPNAELFLKTQAIIVVSIIRDLDVDMGIYLKEEIDKQWTTYYKAKDEWKPAEHFGGTSALDKKAQWVQAADAFIQDLHLDIVDAVQDVIDEGELLT